MKRITIKVLVGLVMLSLLALPLAGACAPEELEEFTLKITAIGEGTTSPAPGTSTITEGESVTVTAIPNTGYELGYWEGDVSGTDDSVTFKMTSDKSVVAVFVEEVVAWQWPETLSVASQGPASPGYPIDVGWTTPLEQDTGTKCRLITEESLPVSFTWLKQGILDVGFADMGAALVPGGLDVFATRELGPCQIRIFWPHGKGGRGFAVRGDSGIETPYDITPETKLIYHSPVLTGPFGKMWVEALLAWANLTPDDIPEENWIEAPSIESTFEFLKEGRGDVVVGWPSSPTWLEVEAAPHGLAWIELDAKADPEGAERYLAIDSAGSFGPMDKGCPSAIGVNMLLTVPSMVVMADKDPELVYNLCKWLDENYDLYKDAHPYCAEMTVENLMLLAEMEFVPLHDGAVQYLDELGLWTDAHEARRQQNIELFNRYEQAYVEAIDMADAQGMAVDPANEEWLELWENYKIEIGLPKFRLWVTFP